MRTWYLTSEEEQRLRVSMFVFWVVTQCGLVDVWTYVTTENTNIDIFTTLRT
jgi:hypothetical protein